jgi:hypothetical protein
MQIVYLVILQGLLTCDPEKRFSVWEALNHPYFEEIGYITPEELQPKIPRVREEKLLYKIM